MPPPVYCGNYEYEASERELERLFQKYGRVEKVEFKTGFCFVFYEETRDAEDAIKDLDGREWGYRHRRLRVEFAKKDSDIKAKEERRREAAPPSTTLFIAGFDPWRTRSSDLERAFEPFGRIKRCNLRKSFCFIEFFDIEDAKAACKELHGTLIQDREITVEFCVAQGAGGGGGGGGGYSDYRRRDDRMSYDRSRDDSRERRRPRSRSGERRRRYSPDRRSRSPVERSYRRRSPPPPRRRSPSPMRRSPPRGRSRSRSPVRERSSMSNGSR